MTLKHCKNKNDCLVCKDNSICPTYEDNANKRLFISYNIKTGRIMSLVSYNEMIEEQRSPEIGSHIGYQYVNLCKPSI